MIVNYNGRREFKCWESNGQWVGVETKYIKNGALTISRKDMFVANNVNEIVDKIEALCKFDELVANGMNSIDAANIALFGD